MGVVGGRGRRNLEVGLVGMHSGVMKRLLLLCLLTLPAWAEVDSLFVDDFGTVSVNWVNDERAAQTIALEGRNGVGQSWRPLGIWNLTVNGSAPAKLHLESEPGLACSQYRVLTFSSSGFLGEQRIAPEGPAALGYLVGSSR